MGSYSEMSDKFGRLLGEIHTSIVECLRERGVYEVKLNGDSIPYLNKSMVELNSNLFITAINVESKLLLRNCFGVNMLDEYIGIIMIDSLAIDSSLFLFEQIEKGYYEVIK